MKVLNVNTFINNKTGGGTAERTLQINRALVREKIKCKILTIDVGLSQKRTGDKEDPGVIALACLLKRFYVPRFSYKSLKSIIKEFDIIHLMNHWTCINAIVYLISMKLNKPYVVCPAGALPIFGRSKILKKIYNWIIGNRIIRDASGHIAISVNEIRHFQKYGVEPDKVSLIPNGIDPEDFKSSDVDNFRQKFGLNDSPFILFVGRLNAIKGPDLLLYAFRNLNEVFSDYHLVFAGPDGGMLSELKNKSEEMEIAHRVHFTGYLGGEEKSSAYSAAS